MVFYALLRQMGGNDMTEKVLNKPMYADEIVKIFRSGLPKDELIEKFPTTIQAILQTLLKK